VVRTRAKICGVTTDKAAEVAVAAGADALGFVFYPPSPRAISPIEAAPIVSMVPPFVQRVALFVDEKQSVIEETLSQCSLDMIQFHGAESRSFCESLGLPYIKAVGFKSRDELMRVSDAHPNAAALLIDAWAPGEHGGTGKTLDWTAIGDIGRPWLLAGGLTPDNVAEAIAVARPYAVDVSSGVESERGEKDLSKIESFLQAVSAWNG